MKSIIRLAPLTLATFLGVSSQAQARNENTVYGSVGMSTNLNNPVNVSVGGGHYKDFFMNFTGALDLKILYERKDLELSMALMLYKGSKKYSFGAGCGVSLVYFRGEPIRVYSKHPVEEPIPEGSGFLRLNCKLNLSEKLSAFSRYQRNLADDILFDHNYPHDRFSAGLEKSLK